MFHEHALHLESQNLCVVFKWWHVRSQFDFILTFVAVVLLGMGYEYIKVLPPKLTNCLVPTNSRLYWIRLRLIPHPIRIPTLKLTVSENLFFTASKSFTLSFNVSLTFQVHLDFIHFAQANIYNRLVFMTYNGWMMIAVTLGAMLGYYVWGYRKASKREMTCH